MKVIKKIVKLTVLFGLVLGVAGQAKAGWYNSSWNYRKEITIDGSKFLPHGNKGLSQGAV